MNNMKMLAACLASAVTVSCAAAPSFAKETKNNSPEKITMCLDWTPNTNHTGLYVALSKGYYEESGLDVEIVQPPENGAVQMCAAGQAQFSIDAQDTLLPSFNLDEPLPVTAVAAILQHNTSGILSRAGEGMDTPKGLEGHTYSTWESPSELAIMQNVVEKDGGDWDKVTLIPNDITDEPGALAARQTDAIWVFYGWGYINSQIEGVDCDWFYFKDINPVFDYYTPVIIANNDFLKEEPETARKFLAATAKGYEFAAQHPDEAAKILIEGDTTGALKESGDLVKKSQKYMAGQYIADASSWGYIDPKRWNDFYSWMYKNKLTDKDLSDNVGFSDDYLPQDSGAQTESSQTEAVQTESVQTEAGQTEAGQP